MYFVTTMALALATTTGHQPLLEAQVASSCHFFQRRTHVLGVWFSTPPSFLKAQQPTGPHGFVSRFSLPTRDVDTVASLRASESGVTEALNVEMSILFVWNPYD